VFAKEGAAAKAVGTRPWTSTREELASIFAEAVEPLVGAFSAANEKRDEAGREDGGGEEEERRGGEEEDQGAAEQDQRPGVGVEEGKKDVDKISDLELELKKAKGRGEGDRQA
jgi:hypothetical protein